jgi:fido (protein-threonine AMPylation protein)
MAADVSLGLRFVFSNTQVTQIMRAIMNRMITSLIRGAERRTLLEDKDSANPSLRVLVHPFLRGNREENREFVERLANFHLQRSVNKRQRAARRRRFDQAVERLTLEWGRSYESRPKTHNRSPQIDRTP